MKIKILVVFIFFMNHTAVAQKIFNTDFNSQVNYIVSLKSDFKIDSDKSDLTSHNHFNQHIAQLNYKQTINNEKYFVWTIKEYFSGNKFEKFKYNFLNNLEIIIKTDQSGKYISIANVENIKKLIRENLQKNKNKKDFYKKIEQNPALVLQIIENEIFAFFRYYGIEKKDYNETFEIKRIGYPFSTLELPYKIEYKSFSSKNLYNINVKSTLDVTKLTSDEWKEVFVNENLKNIKLDDDYSFNINEDYIYNSSEGYFSDIQIKTIKKRNWNKQKISEYEILNINIISNNSLNTN